MKIAVVGCGALGSFYGARLGRDGHDVHFVLRTDYEVVREKGVKIKSAQGDFTHRPECVRDPEEVGNADLVLIGLKTTANHQYKNLIPPLVGRETTVLTLQNGLGNEAALANLFPTHRIMGGLCFVCLNRTEPGVIEHIAHGRIVLGEHDRLPVNRTKEVAKIFQDAGIPCTVTDDLEKAHWEKLIWNVPFNGLGVASTAGFEACVTGELPPKSERLPTCLPTDQLLGDDNWLQLVRDLMGEVVETARALDFDLSTDLIDENIEATRVMGAYRASTLVDFERGSPLELESLFRAPLRHAKQAGVDTPRLERLCQLLQQLQPIAAKPRPLAR
ncbi:MAG: 2-dehydropantoate 2-reductase [Limisphaerales bacterium]